MRLLVEKPRVAREYETIFIVKPDASEEERSRVVERVETIIGRLQGRLLKREEWGKRKLAYRIEKNSHGIYYYYHFIGFNDLVPELERNLRILEPVLKYLTVKIDEDVDADQRIEELSKAPPKLRRNADLILDIDDEDDDDDDDLDDEDDDE